MRNKKTKVWIVTGHNGEGKDQYNPTILGLYAEEHTARYRIEDLQEEGSPYECIHATCVETESWGVDLELLIR
jgi:hypothetical protein